MKREKPKHELSHQKGRGRQAVDDMRARIDAGWTVEQLWFRFADAVSGRGFTYDFESEDELERVE